MFERIALIKGIPSAQELAVSSQLKHTRPIQRESLWNVQVWKDVFGDSLGRLYLQTLNEHYFRKLTTLQLIMFGMQCIGTTWSDFNL